MPYRSSQQVFLATTMLLPVILLALSARPTVVLFSTLVPFGIWLMTFSFLLRFYDPLLGRSEKWVLLGRYFLCTFSGKAALLQVREGLIEENYFLLKKKAGRTWVYCESDSAALARVESGEIRVLPSGLTRLHPQEHLIAAFDLNPKFFEFGPQADENPFEPRHANESYASYHARQLHVQKVKSFTHDARCLVPSFIIQLPAMQPESLPGLGMSFKTSPTNGNGNAWLRKTIGKNITATWQQLVSQRTLDELQSKDDQKNLSSIMRQINQIASGTSVSSKTISDRLPLTKVTLKGLWIEPFNTQAGRGKPA